MGETLAEARAMAGKIQGRRTSADAVPLIALPDGAWDRVLQTSWVEPGYLETDASWCLPGGEPASPLANGGAFGAKRSSSVAAAARELADRHDRAVRVVLSREDTVRGGPKRPPVAIGVRADDATKECAGSNRPTVVRHVNDVDGRVRRVDENAVLADLAEEYSDGICHVTTRQDIQLHFVPLERVPDAMRELASVGLTEAAARQRGLAIDVHANDMLDWFSAKTYAETVAWSKVIVEQFWAGAATYLKKLRGRMRLVTFNGRGFDLPLLEINAFRYGVAAPATLIAWPDVNEAASVHRNEITAAVSSADGTSRASGNCNARVARGGSFYFNARDLRSANRFRTPADVRIDYIGFRVGSSR